MLKNAYLLQTSASIQPRTSPPKVCKIAKIKVANFANFTNSLPCDRTVTVPDDVAPAAPQRLEFADVEPHPFLVAGVLTVTEGVHHLDLVGLTRTYEVPGACGLGVRG